jgi:hypothetical protein
MLVSQIDYNLIGDIVRAKEAVKESVDGVMEGALTAAHLASEVYVLLEHLDKLEVVWRGTPPTEEAPPEQSAQEAPPPEQPAQEAAAEQPQPEQPPPEGQQ